MNRKYVITTIDNIADFNFDDLVNNLETSRYSLDGTKIIAVFEGDTPSFLSEEPVLSHSQALTVVMSEDWTQAMTHPG